MTALPASIAIVCAGAVVAGPLFMAMNQPQNSARWRRICAWAWAIYLAGMSWVLDNGLPSHWSGGFYITLVPGVVKWSGEWRGSQPIPTYAIVLGLALWASYRLTGYLTRLPCWGLLTLPVAVFLAVTGLGSPLPILVVGALTPAVGLLAARIMPDRRAEAGDIVFGALFAGVLMSSAAFS